MTPWTYGPLELSVANVTQTSVIPEVVEEEVRAVRGGEEEPRLDQRPGSELLERGRRGRVPERHHRADVRVRVPVALAPRDRTAGRGERERKGGGTARTSSFFTRRPIVVQES